MEQAPEKPCLLIRAATICNKEELCSTAVEINALDDILPTFYALRSIGYQLMMSQRPVDPLKTIQQNFKLTDYANILALPGTWISADYVCLNLSEIVAQSPATTHFSLEVYGGLYSYWIYHGHEIFTTDEVEAFQRFAQPASGGGPKPTFVNIQDRVFTFATITGGVEASIKMSFDLIAKGKIVHILSGRHGANMLGQLVTAEGVVAPAVLESDHFYKADLPAFSVCMEKQMRGGQLFVEHLEDKAGLDQKSRVLEILSLGEDHVVILNWCVSLLGINEFTVDSFLKDPGGTSAAYFGPLSDVQKRWEAYIQFK
jgi:hypothetical protein